MNHHIKYLLAENLVSFVYYSDKEDNYESFVSYSHKHITCAFGRNEKGQRFLLLDGLLYLLNTAFYLEYALYCPSKEYAQQSIDEWKESISAGDADFAKDYASIMSLV